MGIAFGNNDNKCVEELTKLCLEHPNEVYIGRVDDKMRFVSVDDAWSDQQHFLSEGVPEAIWLKDYYESMYSDVEEQKRLMCATIELYGVCIECRVSSIPKEIAYKIFHKWKIVSALLTEIFEIFIKKYFGFSLET